MKNLTIPYCQLQPCIRKWLKLMTCARLVKIFERPAGQQFAAFQRLLESAIEVGYVFQFSEGVAMDWKTMLSYISGSVDEELLLRNEYLVAENRVLRNQLRGRLRLTDGERRSLAELESVWVSKPLMRSRVS